MYAIVKYAKNSNGNTGPTAGLRSASARTTPGGSRLVATPIIVPQKPTNTSATPNMPSSLPRKTDSSGTAAARTSITLLLRSSAIVPTICPARNSVRKNTPNTAANAA